MQKIKMKAITAILLFAMLLATFPMIVHASTGHITINVVSPGPSQSNQQVKAGGNVSLNFGGVSFSGGQFVLYMSRDGFSQISVGDQQLNLAKPFDVSNLTNPATSSGYTISSSLKWNIGNNWVNGTILNNIPGGNYFIKCFDGSTAQVAVTDTYFIVTPSFTVTPSSGPAGQAVTLAGSAFGASSNVDLNYTYGAVNTRIATVPTDTSGSFSYTGSVAPDLMINLPPGLQTTSSYALIVTYTANETVAGSVLQTAAFTENPRGLRAFGAAASNGAAQLVTSSTTLYGNNTDFTSPLGIGPVTVGVGSFVNITGRNFYPGAASIAWDAVVSPATVTVGSTGSFTVLYTVPVTGLGTHTITITDAGGQKFIVSLTVTSSITLTPSSGPVGTVITVNGYGFPASTSGNVYNVTLTWYGYTTFVIKTSIFTDASGQFVTTITAPHDFGGAHLVSATVNASGINPQATFTITGTLYINGVGTTVATAAPMSSNGALVTVTGTGFMPVDEGDNGYAVNINNLQFNMDPDSDGYETDLYANATGDIYFVFIDAGFQPGLGVVSLYLEDTTVPASYAFFILSGGNTTAALLPYLTQINATTIANNALLVANSVLLGNINGNVSSTLQASLLAAINGTVVQILTNQGVMQTSLNAINATVVSISGNIATIGTSLGTLTTTVNAIGANITSIMGTVATINTNLGTLTTTVNGIGANVTFIRGTVATISTSVGTLQTSVNAINATIIGINSGVATLQTSIGTVQTTVSSINSALTGVSGTVGTISTTVGTIQTSLGSIGTTVTKIDGNVATIITDLGTLQGTVTSTDGKVATIQTDIGTLQTSVDGVKSDVNKVPGQLMVPIWLAVVLALIAAIAAIVCIIQMRRKIAG